MDGGVFTALIAAGSALGGAALAHWGAQHLQAQRLDREAARERSALLRQQRAECLGWVLEAAARIEAALLAINNPGLSSAHPDKSSATAARRAYAVALLSLAAARPAAKAFYQSTARLQLALEAANAADAAAIGVAVSLWRADCEALENLLANLLDEL